MKTDFVFQGKQMLKLLFVAGLSMLLLIPLAILKGSIRERENTAEATISDVSTNWGGRQVVKGPFLEGSFVKTLADRSETVQLDLFPETLDASVTMQTSSLKKGIWKIPAYRSEIILSGVFAIDESVRSRIGASGDLKLCIGLGDLRGLEDQVEVTFGEASLRCSNRTMIREFEENDPGITASFPASLLEGNDTISYAVRLKLKGAASLKLAPVGSVTAIQVTSDYPHPSFGGSFLPTERNVTESGFSALWKVNALNRSFPQVNEDVDVYRLLEDDLAGVDLIVPVSQYQQIERAIKYALLIIVLTMLAIFLMEIWQKTSVNFLQYILTGFDLVLFYSLLFSLSEHIGFDWAFAIAATMTILLMMGYMKSVLGSWTGALGLGAIASLLYIYIFILLQMGDFAFLAGSVGLFILLALVMYFSQKAFSRTS